MREIMLQFVAFYTGVLIGAVDNKYLKVVLFQMVKNRRDTFFMIVIVLVDKCDVLALGCFYPSVAGSSLSYIDFIFNDNNKILGQILNH